MGRKPKEDENRPIMVGLIGAGGMAAYHVEGFRKAGAEVVAIADPDPSAAETAAAAVRNAASIENRLFFMIPSGRSCCSALRVT